LPRAVVERGKTGFTMPVRDWILQMDPCNAGRGLRGWAIRLARNFTFELKERSRPNTPSLAAFGTQ